MSPQVQLPQTLVDEIFPNAPLKEVALELRFDPVLKIERNLADFQEKIRDEYPLASLNDALQIEGEVISGTHFQTEAKERMLRVTVKSFGVMFTRYSSFEAMKEQALKVINIFSEVFHVSRYRRVGLRYINQIPILKEGVHFPFYKYVKPLIVLDRIDPERIARFVTEVRLLGAPANLTIRTGGLLADAEKNADSTMYALDLDAYRTEETLNNLPSLLDAFHSAIQKEFLSQLTEKQIEIMRTPRLEGRQS